MDIEGSERSDTQYKFKITLQTFRIRYVLDTSYCLVCTKGYFFDIQ